MSALDWLVLAGGVAAIGWVNWYFFVAGRDRAAAAKDVAGGVQEVTIVVQGGYSPAVAKVHVGRPVRLIFDRQETSGCSEEIVMADFNIRRYLPPFQKTVIEFTPPRVGEFEFTCGMGMLRGRITVE
ncbi:MAG: cupredoxin domain-containing protein [Gemmataceae bacterium]